MKLYDQVIPARFISRPNRFVANVMTDQGEAVCHVKNTGRCAELLIPNARVYLAAGGSAKRKTAWDLVAVEKGDRLINMDSQAPNRAAREALPWIFPGLTFLRPETVFGDSRLDFYLEQGDKKTFVEVKGVTLEENGIALFPDAPTQRGIRHLRELEKCAAQGMDALLLLVIQMRGVKWFAPNRKTHPAFAEALTHACGAGVRALAYDCVVTPDSMTLNEAVSIHLAD